MRRLKLLLWDLLMLTAIISSALLLQMGLREAVRGEEGLAGNIRFALAGFAMVFVGLCIPFIHPRPKKRSLLGLDMDMQRRQELRDMWGWLLVGSGVCLGFLCPQLAEQEARLVSTSVYTLDAISIVTLGIWEVCRKGF